MAKNWQEELLELLRPLMMCSTEDRYKILLQTNFGKKYIDSFNLQNSILEVKIGIADILMRIGGEQDFLEELKKFPIPEWYKQIKK